MDKQRRKSGFSAILKTIAPEQLIEVLECIEDGIYVAEEDGKILYINGPAAEMLGRAREEMIGKRMWEEFPQFVNSHVHREWLCVAQEHQDSQIETLLPQADQWMDVMMYYCDDVGVITVMRNIHDWMLAEQRSTVLRELTESLSGAITLEQVTQAIFEKGLSVLKGHLGWVALLQQDGQTLRLITNDHTSPAFREKFSELSLDTSSLLGDVILAGEPKFVETFAEYSANYPEFAAYHEHPDGFSSAAMPLSVQGRKLGALALSMPRDQKIEQGDREFFIALAHQCAQAIDRAQLFEAEAEARQAAERANRMRMQFLGMLSHEIRTPLTTIKGFASTLLSPDVTWKPEDQQEFLGIIGYESERLSELVEDLIELSRIEAGRFKVNPQSMSVHHILGEAMPAMSVLAKDHRLGIDVPLDLPEVMADTRRMGQVLLNLVSNAAKHSPQDVEIKLQARQAGDVVQIDVVDQGPGIAPELRDKVFQPFEQGVFGDTDQVGGAGLGLTIARAIVEAHDGRIWIQDTEVGTTISFTLPILQSVTE